MERNDTLPLWIGAIVLVILVGGYFYFSGQNMNSAEGEGKVFVTVSDAAANIQNVNDVSMTVSKVELHSATQGWVTVSSSPRTFDLLTLKAKGSAELAGSADVPADSYDQVRATISKVEVKTKNAGNKTAVLVSNTLTIPGSVVVRAGESSRADLDVQTLSSLHVATAGEYVFAPVVVFESRHSADVSVASDNSVTVSGGTVDSNISVGTDLSGKVMVGSQLSPNVLIQITNGAAVMMGGTATSSGSGIIKIDGSLLLKGSGSGSANTNSGGATTSSSGSVQGSGSGSVNVTY